MYMYSILLTTSYKTGLAKRFDRLYEKAFKLVQFTDKKSTLKK